MKFAGVIFLLLSLFYTGRPASGAGAGLPAGVQDAGAQQASLGEVDLKKTLQDIDVLNKLNAGETDSEIIHDIETNPTAFDVSQPSVVFLRKHGVSQTVINAMVKAAGGKVVPVAVTTPAPAKPVTTPPATVESPKSVPTAEVKPKAPKPDLHKVRKVFLETDWAEDVSVRPRAIDSLEKRTCLKVVETLDDADAKIRWTTQGLMGVAIQVSSKDDVYLWARRGLTPPLKALRVALGCE